MLIATKLSIQLMTKYVLLHKIFTRASNCHSYHNEYIGWNYRTSSDADVWLSEHPLSILRFSFTLSERDSIPKYYEKLHTPKERLRLYCFKMQKPVAHIDPVQFCHPPVAEAAVREPATPGANRAWFLVQPVGGLAYPERSAPRYQLLCHQTPAERLRHASRWRINPEMVPVPYITTDISSQKTFICLCC